MNNEMHEQLRRLERAMADLEKATRRTLGATKTFEYKGILFHVSGRAVVADLSPLAYFEMAEPILDETPEDAVKRLYDRLLPLLSCKHQWTLLKRTTDTPLRSLAKGAVGAGVKPHVCKACTAYTFSAPGSLLPLVGRAAK